MEDLLPLVYADLRALAEIAFRKQRPDHTLQPTALVNETYLRLVGGGLTSAQGRRHFMNVASMAMRQLLADHARKAFTDKRGGQFNRVALYEDTPQPQPTVEVDFGVLDEALSKLQKVDPRQAKIVELRFLAGMTYEEIADIEGIAPRTARLDWQMARAWLRSEIEAQAGD